MKTRRIFHSQHLYEACIRVREGLPFPALKLVKAIIEGTIARVQRDKKITICHFIWMGNHAHILFIIHDAEMCSKFFAEIQKQITESIKKLLALEHLRLWEGEPSIAIILDIDAAKERIRYLYCNPARADLVQTVEDYPGVSSWASFKNIPPEISATTTRLVPWIRQRYLPVLKSRHLSPKQDAAIVEGILRHKPRMHELAISPNAWLKVFGIADANEISAINRGIIDEIRTHEAIYQDQRSREGRSVVGVVGLTSHAILKPHKPSSRSRRIFVLSSIKELRTQFIEKVRGICDYCRELYRKLKQGYAVAWPLGVLPPRSPILANSIAGP